jgi:hypothetical protein
VSFKLDLRNRLLANAEIAALGAGVSWSERPRRGDAFPWIVMQIVSVGRGYTHDGPTNFDEPRIQFDLFAVADAGLAPLAKALRDEMEMAAIRPATHIDVGSTRFHAGFLDGHRSFAPVDLPNQGRVYGETMDYFFNHEPI